MTESEVLTVGPPSVSPTATGHEALLGPRGCWTGVDRVLIPGGGGRRVVKLERVTPQGGAFASCLGPFSCKWGSQAQKAFIRRSASPAQRIGGRRAPGQERRGQLSSLLQLQA